MQSASNHGPKLPEVYGVYSCQYAHGLGIVQYSLEIQAYALILECIDKHAYERSRFLNRGVVVDEAKTPVVNSLDEAEPEPLISNR